MKIILIAGWILLCAMLGFAQSASATESGIELYRNGEFEKAVEVLERLVRPDSTDKLAWIYLGASYVKLEKRKEATLAFQKSKFTYRDSLGVFDKNMKVIRMPKAPYTDRARESNVTGTVKIAVEYKADGKVGFVFPIQTLPEGLTDNCVRAARGIEFEPAIKNGKAVDVVSIVTYSFSIY